MDSELAEISAFVGDIPPFDQLPESKLTLVIKAISICYLKEGMALPPTQCEDNKLFIVRKRRIGLQQ